MFHLCAYFSWVQSQNAEYSWADLFDIVEMRKTLLLAVKVIFKGTDVECLIDLAIAALAYHVENKGEWSENKMRQCKCQSHII